MNSRSIMVNLLKIKAFKYFLKTLGSLVLLLEKLSENLDGSNHIR